MKGRKNQLKRIAKQEAGVTITTMIIAVILVIILAAISITSVLDEERDIFDTAYEARTGIEVSTYQEELEVIKVNCTTNQLNNGLTSDEYIDLFKESVEKDTTFDGSTVEKKSSSILRIETEEGYVFIITADGAEYAGISGEFDEVYELSDDDVTFTYTPSDWTNENVTVEISLNFDIGEDSFQYSFDKETWYDYEEAFEVETNTKIYVMYSTYGDNYVIGEVTNIDKLVPTVDSIIATTSYITFTASDSLSSSYGVSGIVGYYVGTSSTEPDESSFIDCRDDNGDGVTNLEITVSALEQNIIYYIYVIDDAGNISSLSDNSYITIISIPDLTDDIVEFTQSTDDWTNEDVVVYVDITDEDIQEDIDDGTYIIEYSTDGGETWEEYDPEKGITVDENTEVEVRLSDGNNTGESITHEVDNIDKTAPEAEIEVTDSSTNSITVEVTAEDFGDDGTTDSSSGIASYEFQISTDDEDWETIETVETSEETYEYIYEDLTDGTTYYVRVIVTDEAGNSTASEAEEVTLGEVPGGTDDSGTYDEDGVSISTVTFEYSTTEWTNEDVTVTVVVNGDTADLVEDGTYMIEYNTYDPTDENCWGEYTEAVVFETNGSIYARLSDGTNTGDYATGTVANIDKTAPTVAIDSSTSNSITVKITERGSGVVGYYISTSLTTSTEDIEWIELPEDTDVTLTSSLSVAGLTYYYSFDINGLIQNTTYYIWAIDNAGNISSLDEDSYTTTSSVPDLTDEIVEFTQSEDDWTNEDVVVYVDITDEDIQEDIDDGTYILEYSIDGGETWEEYDPEEEITVDENTEIEVRLSDGENTGGEVTHEVDNIDKTAPEVEIELTASTTNSITIEVTAEDLGDDGTSDSASGIVYYEFQISTNGEDWESIDIVDINETSEGTYEYTYEGLTDGTTYYVRVVVMDLAGNSTESNEEEVTLRAVPGGDDDSGEYDEDGVSIPTVTFEYSTTEWTNEDVTVTIVVNGDTADLVEDGTYTIEYNTDDPTDESSWIEYTEAVMFEMNGSIYARLSDGTNTGDYSTGTVGNIDKTAPEVEFEPRYQTTSSIGVEVTAEDLGDDGTSDSASGISSYEFQISTDGEDWETIEIVETSEGTYEYTYEDLTDGTEYFVRVIVTDVAGNSTTSETLAFALEEVPDGDDDSGEYDEDGVSIPTVTFEYSTTEWTNEDVTATVVANGHAADLVEEGEYTIEYNTSDPTDESSWIEYTEAVVFETNGSIYARLTDGTNTGDYATGTVNNIDKIAPTVIIDSSSTSSITVSINEEGSNVVGYYISTSLMTSTEDVEWIELSEDSLVSSSSSINAADLEWWAYNYLFDIDELEQNTTYYIWAIDNAGNISSLDEDSYTTTSSVPDLTEYNVEFTQSTDDWTNESVIVYVNITDEDIQEAIADGTYILEYSTDGGETWEEYDPEEGITVDENTEIKVHLTDGINDGGEVIHDVDNIDCMEPNVDFEVTASTTNSITVEVTAEDIGSDGLFESASGIASYEFQISTDYENWETIEIVETSEGTYEYTYEGLTDGTTYYVRVVVTDVAGNLCDGFDEEVTLGEVPGGDDDSGEYDEDGISIPTVTFEYSETDWTNEDVTVTIVVNGDTADLVEGGTYTIEYNTEDPTDENCWIEYTEEVIFETNGSIYARLSDGINVGDYATGTVGNIDKIAPTVTIESTEVGTTTEVTITGTATDSEATDEYDCSGIDVVYVGVIAEYEDLQTYYNDDGDPVYYDEDDIEWLEATVDEDGNFEYTFEKEYEEIIAETAYVIGAKALDNASNESDIADTISTEDDDGNTVDTANIIETEGDYVDYSATYEVIEDGDSTNDWRLFFITEEEYTSVYGDETISSATCTYDDDGTLVGFTTTADNQVYIIASDYILADNMPTSTSGTSVKYSDDYPYSLYFYNIYSEYTGTANWDSQVDIWNSLYLNSYSSTNNNAKAVEYLLNTSAWGEFYLDTEYGNYVIGSPTLEMWITAWNSNGYSTLYCDKVGSYGYYVSLDGSNYSLSTEYITSNDMENSGYNNTIFYPHQTRIQRIYRLLDCFT